MNQTGWFAVCTEVEMRGGKEAVLCAGPYGLQCAARQPHFNQPAALLAHFETENETAHNSLVNRR